MFGFFDSPLASVAVSPLALIGYIVATVAALLIALKIKRYAKLQKNLENIPEQDRLQALRDEMGIVDLKEGISPAQHIRSLTQRHILVGTAILSLLIAVLFGSYAWMKIKQPVPESENNVAAMVLGGDDVTKLEIMSVMAEVEEEDDFGLLMITTFGYTVPADKDVQVLVNGRDVSSRLTFQTDPLLTLEGNKKQLNLNIGRNEVALKIGAFSTKPYGFKVF